MSRKRLLNGTRAVSLSRISPTRITSGSSLTIDRSPLAKVRPALIFTCIWLIFSKWYSTGSSMVIKFLANTIQGVDGCVKGGRFAGACRAADQDHTVGHHQHLFYCSWLSLRKPTCGRASAAIDLSRSLSTPISPLTVLTVATRTSILLSPDSKGIARPAAGGGRQYSYRKGF